jgi:hypothetical protein
MKDEGPSAFARDEGHLPATPRPEDSPSRERGEPAARGPAQERPEKELGQVDDPATDARSKASDDRLDFGQLGHGDILLDLPPGFD